MVLNTVDRNNDSARREDNRRGTVDRCEVIAVHPHVDPFEGGAGDRDFNVVDVQLIDRPRGTDGAAPLVKRTRINCLQHYHGCVQGDPWTPRIGDMVLVYWIKEREGLVIGTIPSVQQEPICRSEATSEHQEIVHKRAPWEQPLPNQDGNYVLFPSPKHPDCFKWWPKTRDYITVHDCPYGHARPFCDKLAPCTCLDDLQNGTWWKVFSDISPTVLDKPQRVKFHHHCGSIHFFDEDGVIRMENMVAEIAKGHIMFYPPGDIVAESAPETINVGSRLNLFAPDSNYEDEGGYIKSCELVDKSSQSVFRIYKSGDLRATAVLDQVIASELFCKTDGYCWLGNCPMDAYFEIKADGTANIKSPTSINLNAPVINQNGIQIHPSASEGWVE
jgi:hypothetical protein